MTRPSQAKPDLLLWLSLFVMQAQFVTDEHIPTSFFYGPSDIAPKSGLTTTFETPFTFTMSGWLGWKDRISKLKRLIYT